MAFMKNADAKKKERLKEEANMLIQQIKEERQMQKSSDSEGNEEDD